VSDHPADEDLLRAFLGGDDRAFDTLVQRYERRVFAICHRYFGNAADAEDAAQDAFVALLRRGSTFDGRASFSTWMYRVAVNACNDLARKRSRRPQRDDTDVATLSDATGHVADVEEQLAAASFGPEVLTALRMLDDSSREAVVLHDVYGLAYHEIAARTGIAIGTVKSRIHRSHARLAASISARSDHDGGVHGEPSRPLRPPTSSP
jgi:RNA polymerase sigma-70 factor, ECF subfamily